MKPTLILAVAVGGALGSVARYLVGIAAGRAFGMGFPWGTLIISVTGSFLIGAFVGMFARLDVPLAARVPDSRDLWRLHDFLYILSRCLRSYRARAKRCGWRVHDQIGRRFRRCSDRRHAPRPRGSRLTER